MGERITKLAPQLARRLADFITRRGFDLALGSCVLFPLLVLALYGVLQGVSGMFLVSVLSACSGLIAGRLLLQLWEKKIHRSLYQHMQEKMQTMRKEISERSSAGEELEKTRIAYEHQINLFQISLAKTQDENHQLNLEMDKKREEMRQAYFEFEDLQKEYRRVVDEAAVVQEEAQKNMSHKGSLINEYQKTISEQRIIIEKKQRLINKLQEKIGDLTYELRSLLQLETSHPNHPLPSEEFETEIHLPATVPSTAYDASLRLQKYIEKAENLTGLDHLGYIGGKSPRFLDLSLDCYAVDRRRLCDSFKDESEGVLFLYDPIERKYLFINSNIKSLTGWSPEKFMKDYPTLFLKGHADWMAIMPKLKMLKVSSLEVTLAVKGGGSKVLSCYVGILSKGPFAHHVIGMFT